MCCAAVAGSAWSQDEDETQSTEQNEINNGWPLTTERGNSCRAKAQAKAIALPLPLDFC
jgi:hypothetical protein